MESRHHILKGFSGLDRESKRRLVASLLKDPELSIEQFESFNHPDEEIRKRLEQFSENTISSFHLPYGVAPNFLINGRMYMLPMVIEESSVVAAASSAARFWASRGGFRARVLNNRKNGQLHFLYRGEAAKLQAAMPALEQFLRKYAAAVTANMQKRGGGISTILLKDKRSIEPHYFQLHVRFETGDAMGANFINSCLERFSEGLEMFFRQSPELSDHGYEPLMAILSNYNDECLVEVGVSCPVEELKSASSGLSAGDFARRFVLANHIACEDVYRATTHNKGIMNGVDAVILATGNDFRAIEAGAHAYAARSGQYRALSKAELSNNQFHFSLTMPMALGTIGGLTRLHPLAEKSMELLGNPDASCLMMIAAAAGLANNFAALRSLTTTGIQAGHMRMHLPNILAQLQADPTEVEQATRYFQDKKVSHQGVADFLASLRKKG